MKHLLPVLLLFSPLPLLAQTQALNQEIVVTASALPETIESTPAAVTVITKEQIEQRGLRDVADALREVPGVILMRGGSPGKITTLFTRGSNSTHTLVMWNGVKSNNPFFSGYDWGRFSVAGVDRVEVVRGPYSALYGSDAVAGVVNVLTSPKPNDFQIGLQAGENGLFDGALRGTWAQGSWTADAALEHRQDDGFAPNDDLGQQTAMAGLSWSTSAVGIGLRSRYMTYEVGIPFSTNAAGSAFEPRLHRREGGDELQIVLPARYTRGGWHHQLTLSRNENRLEFEDPDDPFGRTDATTDTDANRALFTTRVATRAGTITGGAEYERARVFDVSSYGVSIDDRTRTSRSAFLEDRLSLAAGGGSIELALGVRHDDFDAFGGETSPRLAAAWLIGKNKIRAAFGRAFRAPSIGELYIGFFGNPDLQAERTRSAEVGLDRFFHSGARLSVTAFHSDFENLIVYDNITNIFQNIGQAESRGLELAFHLPMGTSLATGGSYTWLDTEAVATGLPLLRRPKHSGTLSAHLALAGVASTLVIVHSGQRDDVTDLFPFGRVMNDPYTVADLKLEYDAGALRPYLKLENVTDEEYQEVFGYPSPRRRAIVGLRWSASR